MRILLCQPASNIMKNRKEGKPALPPLGLMSIAATLRKERDDDIQILDVMTEGFYNETSFKKDYIRYGLSPKEIKAKIKEFNPDIVGVSCMASIRKYHAYEICELAKAVDPNIITVVGGNHITCFPKEALAFPEIDFAVIGEGEQPFLELVKLFDNERVTALEMENKLKEIKGLCFRKSDGTIQIPEKANQVDDVDKIPFPAHDLIDLDMYSDIWNKEGYQTYKARKYTMSLMARGCPNKCLSGDTLVNTVEGKIPIKNLIGRDKIGVYTYDPKTKKIFITDAINIRKSDINRTLIRVHFDDNTYIDCTPDHEFLNFNHANQFIPQKEIAKEAQYLKNKDRVRAIKIHTHSRGYITVEWGRRQRELEHRLVAEYKIGRKLKDNELVHHIDGDKKNNLIQNIEVMDKSLHFKNHPEISERMKIDNPVKYLTKEGRERGMSKIRGRKQSFNERINHRNSVLGNKNGMYKDGKYAGTTRIKEINHKVVRIENLQSLHDVYDLEVPSTNWFFANDVLVHNCRHCPHDVIFPGYRSRSAKNLMEEVKVCYDLGIREIQYHEYNGIVNWKIVEEFCNLMIESGMNKEMRWGWPIGIWLKRLTRDRLKLMREAGMDYVCLAIESSDQSKLDEVMKGKDVDLEHTLNVVKWCREFNYQIHSFFMLGLEGQSKKDIEHTIKFAKSLDIDSASFFIAQPLPGTPFWDHCEKEDLFLDGFDTFHLRYGKANHKVDGITPSELEEYRHRARKEFIKAKGNRYLRKKEIFKENGCG